MSGVTSTSFPCGSALGASWDVALLSEIGDALAHEARSKGADILLGPTVNLHRHPLAGRNFECFSEDPELTARLAVAWIEGLQRNGVGAALKHFACNDQEHERMSVSVEVDETTLREVYLRPFEAAVAAAPPWLVMAAYNRLRGVWCCEHPELLQGILKNEWGFDGVVVSDWYATHSTVASAEAGLDLEMPGPARFLGVAVADTVRAGELDEQLLDAQARRVLRLILRAGPLDPVEVPERSEETPERRSLARRAARSGMVLLENDGVLPLDPMLRRIALIGPCAEDGFPQGGGSAVVIPHRVVGLADGLRDALGNDVQLDVARGVALGRYAPPIRNDLLIGGEWKAEFWPGPTEGPAVHERRYRDVQFTRFGIATDAIPNIRRSTVRFSATLVPDQSGDWEFSVTPGGTTSVRVGGTEIIVHEETGTGYAGPPDDLPTYRAAVALREGVPTEIVAEVSSDDPEGGGPRLYLGAVPPDPDAELRAAAELASTADVAILAVGTGPEFETEGSDRAGMALPGGQNRLVEAVLDAQPNTVVVVNAGAPLELPWAARARAVLWAWFPGQELGHAIADVLLGLEDPGGRLPCAFPARLADTAAFEHYPGADGTVSYTEGVLIGQRHHDAAGIPPAWPLGHGLSYARFRSELRDWEVAEDGTLRVGIGLTNIGARRGSTVVQIYGQSVDGPAAEPRRLIGFAKTGLVEPGHESELEIVCPPRALARWDAAAKAWNVHPGEYVIEVGYSAGDIIHRFTASLTRRVIPTPAV